MKLLLPIHDLLHLLKIGLADQTRVDHLDANNFIGRATNLRAVPLATITLEFRGRWRSVTLLIDDAPAGVDRIAQNDAHSGRRNSCPLPDVVVANVACQKEPERFPDLFCAWSIEPAEIPVISDAVRQSYLALRILSAFSLGLLRPPHPFANFFAFNAGEKGPDTTHKPSHLASQVYWAFGEVQNGFGVCEVLQERVIVRILGSHQS